MTPLRIVGALAVLACFIVAMKEAYEIRLFAIQEYGKIIHEFDPWFNMRATTYLARNGISKFFTWFDHESWYPIGRPVGTTIYPGLQLVSVAIWRTLLALGYRMSLNDVCVFFPAWFGSVATALLGLLTWECTGSALAGATSALVMAVIPAHLMRSIGGGFDNESLATSAMVATFLFWIRSIRNESSWYWGIVAGLFQVSMAAAWGGYVFVCNIIGVHAIVCVFLGYFTPGMAKAYGSWWLVGAVGSSFIPVIGWAPFRSLEQVGPMGVFGIMVLLYYIETVAKQQKLNAEQKKSLLFRTFMQAGAVATLVFAVLAVGGFFGPLSIRVRSLFFRHTRTGNPLVDSVSEHQPASASAYWQHLLQVMYLAPIGAVLCMIDRSAAKYFLVVYGVASFYFARKMNRLIILSGPIGAALAGVALDWLLTWVWVQFKTALAGGPSATLAPAAPSVAATAASAAAGGVAPKPVTAKKDKEKGLLAAWSAPGAWPARAVVAVFLVLILITQGIAFYTMSNNYSHMISQPSLMYKARLNSGKEIIVDDYLRGYEWIKDNTPQDSRILSWWDYGYQIAGIANRTTLADGNTWNLEHIALIGKMLTASQPDSHAMIRHLADYVLVWAGGGGDDLAKSPHIARIASSVYDGICPNDPFCRNFGFYDGGKKVTPSMARSLLYNLVANGRDPEARVDARYYQEVFSSQYGLLRVYKVLNVDQASKAWLADPANRLCDRPGSWYCPGQYPKAIPKPPSSHRHLDYERDGAGAPETH